MCGFPQFKNSWKYSSTCLVPDLFVYVSGLPCCKLFMYSLIFLLKSIVAALLPFSSFPCFHLSYCLAISFSCCHCCAEPVLSPHQTKDSSFLFCTYHKLLLLSSRVLLKVGQSLSKPFSLASSSMMLLRDKSVFKLKSLLPFYSWAFSIDMFFVLYSVFLFTLYYFE